jgi:hypothetical protein
LANRDVVQTLGLAAHQTNDLCRFAHPIAEVGLAGRLGVKGMSAGQEGCKVAAGANQCHWLIHERKHTTRAPDAKGSKAK